MCVWCKVNRLAPIFNTEDSAIPGKEESLPLLNKSTLSSHIFYFLHPLSIWESMYMGSEQLSKLLIERVDEIGRKSSSLPFILTQHGLGEMKEEMEDLVGYWRAFLGGLGY